MVVDGWNGVGPALGLRSDACSRVRACDGEVSNGGGLFNIPSTIALTVFSRLLWTKRPLFVFGEQCDLPAISDGFGEIWTVGVHRRRHGLDGRTRTMANVLADVEKEA